MRFTVLGLLVLGACATVGPSARSADFDRFLIANVRRMAGESLYDVVTRVRPNYLRARSPLIIPLALGEDLIGVFVNGLFAGGLEALRDIDADYVYSIRKLPASEAVNRHGRRFREGVIEVALIRR